MKYLNEAQKAEAAASIAALPADHVERVIFDKTLEALLPSRTSGRYGDASEAMKDALASVFEFRELVAVAKAKPEGDAPDKSDADDEIPF